ncbi:helix-turn-helix transcriptional regulator [Variovorax sp. NFACC27]|uniref:helix-turn-helix domain-containing protein n=1 Tax=unclassified Variovorax TaxID=663243 RepID=UPI0008963452|nr:Helix-turn-helix [Variovorax sp. NFACC28]SEG77948.1 Helix-turn-helix [Variovorax sp. NFACC29]SFG09445.1 Helix-turn-helix [Variovorax sp. NFACC27]
MTQIQAVIRQLRATLSQSEIARRTGIAQSKISRWEAGKVAAGAEEALKLAALAQQLPAAQSKEAA